MTLKIIIAEKEKRDEKAYKGRLFIA